MKDQLRMLCELQAVEQQKRAIAGRKEKISGEEARLLWQEIRLLTQDIAAGREKAAGLEKTCARREADLSVLIRQCQQLEEKLYGGQIANIKEIEQVRARCESLRRDIAQRENEAVAVMEELEKVGAKLAGDEERLQEKKRRHAEKQQRMTQEAARCDAELAGLEDRGRALGEQIDQVLLRQFSELGRKIPQPVARVEAGVCGGCRRSIPTAQAAQAQVKLIYCDNCGRMLFVE